MDRRALMWYAYTSASFLNGYFSVMARSPVLPSDVGELAHLLDAYLLEKAIYELGYELGNRPTWTAIPLRALMQILEVPDE